MTDYAFAPSVAYDRATSSLATGATFTFQDASGTPIPMRSLAGDVIGSVTSDGNGVVPGFLVTDVSVGVLVNAAGLRLPVLSTWAQDPAQVRASVQAASDAAQAAAATAGSTVAAVSAGLNALGGRVTQLEQASTAKPGIAGAKTPQYIYASDYSNAWPSPVRLSGDPSYSVTFIGSIAQPPAVASGSPDGMQPGDFYIYTGS